MLLFPKVSKLIYTPINVLSTYYPIITLLCPTLCNPTDWNPSGSSGHGIFPGKNTGVGCHFLLQGSLPDPGIKPASPASPALAGGFFTIESPGRPSSQQRYDQNF